MVLTTLLLVKQVLLKAPEAFLDVVSGTVQSASMFWIQTTCMQGPMMKLREKLKSFQAKTTSR